VGLRRRLGGASQEQQAGECLAATQIKISGDRWQKLGFSLNLTPGQVSPGEPVDFFLQWLPQGSLDLLIDRAVLNPSDAVEGIFDPDVLQMVRDWRVPLLRWPGGNFVSHYHWRDAVGPVDRRPTRPNYAWGGFETNFFGTSEFLHFCRLVNAEPHLVVNSGTGTAEEAAAWVEYCNGDAATPMGALRAANDRAEPYNVKLWEVGNETYGSWQGGYHGGEENSLRYAEFSTAMLAVDASLELMATGNQFDIAEPGPGLDHTAADRQWNRAVIEANPGRIDFLSLHSLPANNTFLETLTDEEAYYSLMAQPDAWERIFLPDILQIDAEARAQHPGPGSKALRIAITEWGVLGPWGNRRPVVENYGEVVYAGIFLNMVMRNCDRIPVCNATALLHGGCIRKAGGQVFADPQYLVLQKYTSLAGADVYRCQVDSPAYTVQSPPDLGLALEGVPFLDAVGCFRPHSGERILCLVNRHLKHSLPLRILPETRIAEGSLSWSYLAHSDVTARAKLGDSGRFAVAAGLPTLAAGEIRVELPPASVSWISFSIMEEA
jgi:alpha-N-arabinofuranosidase